jgi:hypothetical protein
MNNYLFLLSVSFDIVIRRFLFLTQPSFHIFVNLYHEREEKEKAETRREEKEKAETRREEKEKAETRWSKRVLILQA